VWMDGHPGLCRLDHILTLPAGVNGVRRPLILR
jgi:hypothetical protein